LLENCKQEFGIADDDKRVKDCFVQIGARRLYVTVSNGWSVLGKEIEIKLKPPDQGFVCKSDQTYKLDHFINHEMCALVFRIQYETTISFLGQQQ